MPRSTTKDALKTIESATKKLVKIRRDFNSAAQQPDDLRKREIKAFFEEVSALTSDVEREFFEIFGSHLASPQSRPSLVTTGSDL